MNLTAGNHVQTYLSIHRVNLDKYCGFLKLESRSCKIQNLEAEALYFSQRKNAVFI